MIMQHFPDPKEQGRALATFGAFGAVGNVTGFILGSVHPPNNLVFIPKLTCVSGWRPYRSRELALE